MRHTRFAWPILPLCALLAFLLVGCGVPGTIHNTGKLPQSAPAPTKQALPPIQFPQDEAPHHNLVEWWYYTGHLQGTDAQGQQRHYGFELTVFQTLRGDLAPYYIAHYAISDLTRGQYHFDQQSAFESPSAIPAPGSTTGFHVMVNGWSAQGLNGHDQLSAAMQDYAIQLTLTGLKPAALHNAGLITYGQAGYSYYYSRTRMAVAGALTDHGTPVQVSGVAWMDHQWGDFLTLVGTGWDWYSIQLDNNTEYMLYIIRDAQKRPVSVFGSRIAPDGTTSEIAAQDIQIQAKGTWTSPQTGAVYPSGWDVTLPTQNLSLTLTPLLLDQEFNASASTGNAYWEGAVGVTGSADGQPLGGESYVELTGYAPATSASGVTGGGLP